MDGSSARGRHSFVPFDERLSALIAVRRHIAYYYESPDTSTFRYRVLNMIEALAADARAKHPPHGFIEVIWITATSLWTAPTLW